jgi:membrane dipeptidase
LEAAHTVADARRAIGAARIASFLTIEGGQVIDGSLDRLREYFALGVRAMTLTHNCSHDWADAALDVARHGGLGPLGVEVVREMNRLGMLVDLSHVSAATMHDALDVSRAPVIFSHSSARAVADHPRNVPDDVLQRLRENGGVVMVNFYSGFIIPDGAKRSLDRFYVKRELEKKHGGDQDAVDRDLARWEKEHPIKRGTIHDVVDHVEHIVQVAGIDHVGIGGDYDGTTGLPEGLEDVSKYPHLFAELIRRGWSDADLKKLAGGNVLRAMRAAETTAARLQKSRKPSTRTIEELDRAAPAS